MEEAVTAKMKLFIQAVAYTILIVLTIIIVAVIVYVSIWFVAGIAVLTLFYTIFKLLTAKKKLEHNEL